MEPPTEIPNDAVLATATRSGRVESWHRGSLVVVQDGRMVRSMGDPDQLVYSRSAVKPLQALPFLECGLAEKLQIEERELAVMIASHNGTGDHVEAVRSLLTRGGFTEEDLRCGPHAPFDGQARADLARRGEKPGRIHNNCSGKHAGFLHQAAASGVPRQDYLDPESSSQMQVRRTLAEMAGIEAGDLGTGLDGCGAPTFRLPLRNLAIAFENLANPDALSPVRSAACSRILAAATREPVQLAGQGRFCTALVQAASGQLIPKNGAEGVYALGLVHRRIGIAVKISDGNERAYWPVVVELLTQLGLWGEVPAGLRDFHRVPIYNTQRLVVGEVCCVPSL
jgi:L-asparaginase II